MTKRINVRTPVCGVILLAWFSAGHLLKAAPIFEEFVREKAEQAARDFEKAKAGNKVGIELREVLKKKVNWEAELKKLEDDAVLHREANEAWVAADEAVKEEVKTEANELSGGLEAAADATAKEEELNAECASNLRGVFKEAACFCLTEYIETKKLPTVERLGDHVFNKAFATGLQCVNARVGAAVAQHVNEAVGKHIEVYLNKKSNILLGSLNHRNKMEAEQLAANNQRALQLLHLVCPGS